MIPVFDHGFLYGEGVYETLRTYHRVPFLYERHARRLRQSAALMALPVPQTDAELLDGDARDDGRARRASTKRTFASS